MEKISGGAVNFEAPYFLFSLKYSGWKGGWYSKSKYFALRNVKLLGGADEGAIRGAPLSGYIPDAALIKYYITGEVN